MQRSDFLFGGSGFVVDPIIDVQHHHRGYTDGQQYHPQVRGTVGVPQEVGQFLLRQLQLGSDLLEVGIGGESIGYLQPFVSH